LAVLEKCRSFPRLADLLDMLPLKSKIQPMEIGTSPAEKVTIPLDVIFQTPGNYPVQSPVTSRL